MNIRQSLIVLVAGFALAQTAAAQVFVIGGGLSNECYETTQAKHTSFGGAERVCTRALNEETMTRSNRAATYVNRGVMRMRNGRYDSAISDYSNALRISPDLGAAYLNEGAAHIYKKDFSAAITPLNRAIALESKDIFAAYYNRAIALENTGDIPGAYADFQKALKLKPEWALVQDQLSRFVVTPAAG